MTDPVLLGEDPWGHNHDERLWGDPYAFRPERFLGEAARRPGSVSWLLRANAGDRVPGAWTLVFGFAGVAITGVTGWLGPQLAVAPPDGPAGPRPARAELIGTPGRTPRTRRPWWYQPIPFRVIRYC